MSHEFETKKNVQAGTITGVIIGALLLFLFLVSWSIPTYPISATDGGLEVNLGNSDDGSGQIQPMIPGEPAEAREEVNKPPKSSSTVTEDAKALDTEDKDAEAPEVHVPKPKISNPKSLNIPSKDNTSVAKVKSPKPEIVENPKPAEPKPKYLYKGGNGTGPGGNEATTWNNSRSEGNTTGTGDRGKINGDPNSRNYEGSGGSGGGNYSVIGNLRGRKIIRQPSFKDDFNENAKVAVDLIVDASGSVISAEYQPKGSTTSDSDMKDIAIRKARQLKFASGEEQRGTIIFNFHVTN